jgi:hypothetical protein
MDEDLRKWFKQKWVNIGKKVDGKHPPCGTSGDKKGYAKCVPAAKAASMSKKEKESATRRKRAAQNKAGRGGSDSKGQGKTPIYVSTKPKNEVTSNEKEMIDGIVEMLLQVKDLNNRKKMALDRLKDFEKEGISVNKEEFLDRCGLDSLHEDWSEKYKNSIDCNNPKGFSQKAHCQGRKKNEMTIEERLNLFFEENCPTSPDKWDASKAAARSKFDVYPSAYANAWASKNYKEKGGGWRTCKESVESNGLCEDCWDGYKSVGGKIGKDGKMVPNCVPKKENIMKLKKEMNHDVTDHPERRDKDGEINYGRVEPLEYDVDNYDDHVDFIEFMREYTKQLNEAGCGCVYEAEYQGRSVKLGKPMQGDVKKFKVYVRNGQGNVVKVNFGDPNMRIKKSNPERRKSFRARHNCDNPGPRWKARYWSCRKW